MYAHPAGYVVVFDSDIVKIVVALLQGVLTLQKCLLQVFLLYIHTLLGMLLKERERKRERLGTRERERKRQRERDLQGSAQLWCKKSLLRTVN